MSRISFHAEHETVDVSGSERAHMGILLTDHTYHALFRSSATREALRLTDDQWDRNRFVGASMGGGTFSVAGKEFNYLDVILNTALKTGPDPLRLAARLHGQCEIHAYVEGANRTWLADLIEAGFDNVFRRKLVSPEGKMFVQGWENVLALLRATDDGPVITSYSVTEDWPDVTVVREFGDWHPTLSAKEDDDNYWDEYYDAFYDEPNRWEIAMAALRKASEVRELEIESAGFREFYFGDGSDAAAVIRTAEQATLA